MIRYNHGYVSTTEHSVYEGGQSEVQSIFICNTSGSNTTYSIFHIPKDEDPSNEFALFFETPLKAKTTHIIETPFVINPGEKLTAAAGAADSVVLTMYLSAAR